MASSGSFTTSSRGATQYPRNATFNWWQTGQSIDGNYTDISWNFVLGGGTSNNATIAIYAGSITVNGATTNFNYGGAYKKNGFVLASGSSRIYHNADGTKAFNANGGVNIYGSSQWYGGSQDFWLNTIARSVDISSVTGSFTDENLTPTINWVNNGNRVDIKLELPTLGVDPWKRWNNKQGVSSFSPTFTQTEINDLLSRMPNTNTLTLRFTVVTVINGVDTFFSYLDKTFTVVNGNPQFANYAFADTNATTTAITGNDQVMISGKSALAVTISAANKATAKKSATMAKYTFQVAGLNAEQAYTTSDITKALGSPTVAPTELPSGTRDLVVTAIDSRGYSTAVTKRVTIVPYKAPTISASATRLNGFESETTIKIAGTFSRIEVGGTAKNTVDANSGVQYRYKAQSTTTWGSWTSKTATIDAANGKVTVADFKLNLDNQNAYDFEVKITDRLQTETEAFTVAVGQPAFYIGADGRVGVGGMPTKSKNTGESGLLQVMGRIFADNLYPVGSIYMTTTMTSASQVGAALGGTWEAWGAGRFPVGVGVVDANNDDWCGHTSAGDWTVYPDGKGGETYHTLTVNEMPKHSHWIRSGWSEESGGSDAYRYQYWGKQNLGWHGGNLGTNETGNGAGHNNLPPYVAVYMWKRIA